MITTHYRNDKPQKKRLAYAIVILIIVAVLINAILASTTGAPFIARVIMGIIFGFIMASFLWVYDAKRIDQYCQHYCEGDRSTNEPICIDVIVESSGLTIKTPGMIHSYDWSIISLIDLTPDYIEIVAGPWKSSVAIPYFAFTTAQEKEAFLQELFDYREAAGGEWQRGRHRLCTECGYDLFSIEGVSCPECGTTIQFDSMTT